MKIKIACLSLFLATSGAASSAIDVRAECPRWERLSQSAQKAFDAGDYERAEQIWLKAADEAAMCNEREPSVPISFKRLGECYQKDGKFIDADLAYQKAADGFKRIGVEDGEIAADIASLTKVYRVGQFCELNKGVADAFKEAARPVETAPGTLSPVEPPPASTSPAESTLVEPPAATPRTTESIPVEPTSAPPKPAEKE